MIFTFLVPLVNRTSEGLPPVGVCMGGGGHGQTEIHITRYGQQAGGTHPTGILSCCMTCTIYTFQLAPKHSGFSVLL